MTDSRAQFEKYVKEKWPLHTPSDEDMLLLEDSFNYAWQACEAQRLVGPSEERDAKASGETSDGYHTFNELYDHRVLLYINLCLLHASECTWKRDFDDWFLLVWNSEVGQISYHCQEKYLKFVAAKIKEAEHVWDGHTSSVVIERLQELILISSIRLSPAVDVDKIKAEGNWPLFKWVEKYAPELDQEIKCHVRNLSSCSKEEIEDISRCVLISVRQWQYRAALAEGDGK